MTATGRNDPCPCGSGKKYKQCCLGKDEAKERAARKKAEAEAPVPSEASEAAEAAPERRKKHQDTYQPWKGAQNTKGFNKVSAPRKVGSG